MSDHSDPRALAEAVCRVEGFSLEEEIGEGAFKHSFLVRTGSGDGRCLKLYKSHFSRDRSDREIEAIRRCDHPAIAKLKSVGSFEREGRRTVYCVEEYIDGGSLEELLAQRPLTQEEAVELGRKLLPALAQIEALNLVHRDIKPANIMLREDGSPVLVDFGIVRVLGDTSITPTWQPQGPGTPLFAAPEQLTNQKELIDWRTDQFGLGVTLAMAALAAHPYARESETGAEVIQRVLNRDGPSASFGKRVREQPLQVVAKMVQPWPVQRFRGPDDLIAAWPSRNGGD